MPQNLVDAAGEALKAMNPYPEGNPGGRCITCAVEVAQVLTQGRDARPIVAVHPDRFEELVKLPSEFAEQEEGTDEKRFKPKDGRAEKAWSWLRNDAEPGRVYIARGAGHVWNFVKDFHSRTYLIDMSMRLIKQVDLPQECRGRYRDYKAPGITSCETEINYLAPADLSDQTNEKPLKVFVCRGVLHPRWTPPPPPGNQ